MSWNNLGNTKTKKERQKTMGEIHKRLGIIQSELKAPKGQFNRFGNYKYRSAEDILEAVKPLLAKHRLVLTLSDDVVAIGAAVQRYYVKSSARLCTIEDEKDAVIVFSMAREEDVKKGMDGSQITGAASSYARKYALNGLFAIDDTKDSDATNDHGRGGGRLEAATPPSAVTRAAELKANAEIAQAKILAWKAFKAKVPDLSVDEQKTQFREKAEKTVGIPCDKFAASDWRDVLDAIKSESEG